jgi:Tfp pilus assembly protein PilX
MRPRPGIAFLRALRRAPRDESGAVLIMVLAFSLIMVTVGLAFMTAGTGESRNSEGRQSSSRAFWIAEAGYQRFAAEEFKDPSWALSHRTFNEAVGGGNYVLTVDDTTIAGLPHAFHLTSIAAITRAGMDVGGNNLVRRTIDVATVPDIAAYDYMLFANNNVNIQSNSAYDNLNGRVHADNTITVPSGDTLKSNWTYNTPLKPPALFTSPDSFGPASQVTFYYVKQLPQGAGKWKLEIYGRDGTTDQGALATNQSLSGGRLAYTMTGDDFSWTGSKFPNDPGTTSVVVDFGKYQTSIDLTVQAGAAIRTTLINTTYVGPGSGTVSQRQQASNWAGGSITLANNVVLTPPNGAALFAYDIKKGSGAAQIGNSTQPELTYGTHDVTALNGSTTYYGTIIALHDIQVSGSSAFYYSSGFIQSLPGFLSNPFTSGATVFVTLANWQEIASP